MRRGSGLEEEKEKKRRDSNGADSIEHRCVRCCVDVGRWLQMTRQLAGGLLLGRNLRLYWVSNRPTTSTHLLPPFSQFLLEAATKL